MAKEYSQPQYSEFIHYADIAKTLPRDQAEVVQRVLFQRALQTGCTSPEIQTVISSITDRFVDEDREMRRKAIEEDLRRRGVMSQKYIEADDDQIIMAIKLTLHKFQSDKDWGGVYRILVDFCGFPAIKTDFVRRFARMGIYPQDDILKDFERNIPPAIRGTEWCDHPFSYQAMQKGINSTWPLTYREWEECEIINKDFQSRKQIAKFFLNNLLNVTSASF